MILIKQIAPGNGDGWEYIPVHYENITRDRFLHDLLDNAAAARQDLRFEWESTFEVYGVDAAELAAGLDAYTIDKPIRNRIDLVLPCITMQWEKADEQEILWFDVIELEPDLETLMMTVLHTHAKIPR